MTLEKNELAIYANYFRIGHNASEFILECCQLYEDGEEVQVASRIVFTPATARELHHLLEESLLQQAQQSSRNEPIHHFKGTR